MTGRFSGIVLFRTNIQFQGLSGQKRDTDMETRGMIFLIAVIVAGIFLFRIVVRIFIKIILLLILLVIASYILFFYNGGLI